ncbi:MAG: hypothetical protein MRJ65_08590 [Candidatus Brocadiaceae bacterium]|nr:hypothetical protein [Candidatus Brocadiaceae bacterium]
MCFIDNYDVIYHLNVDDGKISGFADHPECGEYKKIKGTYEGVNFEFHVTKPKDKDCEGYTYTGFYNPQSGVATGTWVNDSGTDTDSFTMSAISCPEPTPEPTPTPKPTPTPEAPPLDITGIWDEVEIDYYNAFGYSETIYAQAALEQSGKNMQNVKGDLQTDNGCTGKVKGSVETIYEDDGYYYYVYNLEFSIKDQTFCCKLLVNAGGYEYDYYPYRLYFEYEGEVEDCTGVCEYYDIYMFNSLRYYGE